MTADTTTTRPHREYRFSDGRMTGTEVIAELEWLFSFNVDAELAAQLLGRQPAALRRMLERYDRKDLASRFHRPEWRTAA